MAVPVCEQVRYDDNGDSDRTVERKANARHCLQYMESVEYLDEMGHLENVENGYRTMNAFDKVNYGLVPTSKSKKKKADKAHS